MRELEPAVAGGKAPVEPQEKRYIRQMLCVMVLPHTQKLTTPRLLQELKISVAFFS